MSTMPRSRPTTGRLSSSRLQARITFEEALRQRLECGQTEGRFEELDPDTDYFIYAYRMDETGRADGAVARSEFRTQPAPEELVRFTFSTPVLEYTRMTVVTEASTRGALLHRFDGGR